MRSLGRWWVPLVAGMWLNGAAAARGAVTFERTDRFTLAVGSDGPQAVAVGDVNRDNRPDIVAVNADDNTVTRLVERWERPFLGRRRPPIRRG